MSTSGSTNAFTADRAREQNDRLKEALEECKSQLNELLYEDNKVSDTTIKNECLDLYDSIETWIGKVFYSEEKDFNLRFKEMLQEERKNPMGRLADLGLQQERWMDLLSTQNSCNCVVLSVVIWKHLETEVFDQAFPIGTTKDEKTEGAYDGSSVSWISGHTTLLEDIMDVMKDKYRNHDSSRRINKWKSETLTAMVATSAFINRQKEYLNNLCAKLLSKLDCWISPATLSSNEEDLFSDVIVPAVKLHQVMVCSSTRYKMRQAEFERGIALKQLEPWTVKNIKTWTQISNTDLDWFPLYNQFPGLYRIDKTKDLELIKPVVVVFKEQDGRNINPSSIPRDSEVQLSMSKRFPPNPDSAESSQSDSQRSSRRSKSKSKSKERKRKPPETHSDAKGGVWGPFASFGKSRRGSVIRDPKQHHTSYDHGPPLKTPGYQRSRPNRPPHEEPRSPRPRTTRHQSMSESHQPASPERAGTFPTTSRRGMQEADQIIVQEEYEDSRNRGKQTVYSASPSKSSGWTQPLEALSRPREGQNPTSSGSSKSYPSHPDSTSVDRFASSQFDNVSIGKGPMRQPPRGGR